MLKRSNQLNLSTHRYTQEEFISLLTSENVLCYAFKRWDKFGDYGTIGFISIILGNIPKIKDLLISCRIAQKHYEHSLIYWVSQKLKKNGYQELYAKLIKTKRNTPLQIMFQSLPFNVIEDNNEFVLYKVNIAKNIDFLWCAYKDISMSFIIYYAASLKKHILAQGPEFTAETVQYYSLGTVIKQDFSNIDQALKKIEK